MADRFKIRHEQFFEQLYKSRYPKLAAYASLFLKSEEAHDAVQEVFLDLLEKKKIRLDASTQDAYLYRAVQNKCVDMIRHRTVKDQYSSAAGQKLLQTESEYFYASRNEIEDALLSKELREHIDAAVEMLPPKGREVFKLYFEHQKSAKEIGAILEISRSTVENHIYTCVKALRLRLAKYLFIGWILLHCM